MTFGGRGFLRGLPRLRGNVGTGAIDVSGGGRDSVGGIAGGNVGGGMVGEVGGNVRGFVLTSLSVISSS